MNKKHGLMRNRRCLDSDKYPIVFVFLNPEWLQLEDLQCVQQTDQKSSKIGATVWMVHGEKILSGEP